MDENPLEAAIERVLAGEQPDTDWRALEKRAGADPLAWKAFALAWRDRSELGRAVQAIEERAERLEIGDLVEARRVSSARRFAWAGWAAAAAVAVAWIAAAGIAPEGERFAGPPVPGSSEEAPLRTASGGEAPAFTGGRREEAMTLAGTREGTLVSELPLVLLSSRPLEGGEGVEIVVLRQLLEKRSVRGLMERGIDEWGRPVAVPAGAPPSAGDEL
jgi:hypothetical protein